MRRLQFLPFLFYYYIMKNPRRTAKQKKLLGEKVVKYYFDNPNANSYREIKEKFKVHETAIRQFIGDELERRLERNKKIRNY